MTYSELQPYFNKEVVIIFKNNVLGTRKAIIKPEFFNPDVVRVYNKVDIRPLTVNCNLIARVELLHQLGD